MAHLLLAVLAVGEGPARIYRPFARRLEAPWPWYSHRHHHAKTGRESQPDTEREARHREGPPSPPPRCAAAVAVVRAASPRRRAHGNEYRLRGINFQISCWQRRPSRAPSPDRHLHALEQQYPVRLSVYGIIWKCFDRWKCVSRSISFCEAPQYPLPLSHRPIQTNVHLTSPHIHITTPSPGVSQRRIPKRHTHTEQRKILLERLSDLGGDRRSSTSGRQSSNSGPCWRRLPSSG